MGSSILFREILDAFHKELKASNREDYDSSEMEYWILHRAHELMRLNVISKEEFAEIMDEAVCW